MFQQPTQTRYGGVGSEVSSGQGSGVSHQSRSVWFGDQAVGRRARSVWVGHVAWDLWTFHSVPFDFLQSGRVTGGLRTSMAFKLIRGSNSCFFRTSFHRVWENADGFAFIYFCIIKEHTQ